MTKQVKIETGIYKQGDKFIARVHAGGKNHYLGRFDSFEEAKKTRERERPKLLAKAKPVPKTNEPNISIKGSRYCVKISNGKKMVHFGCYDTLQEAIEVRDREKPRLQELAAKNDGRTTRGKNRLNEYKQNLIGKRYGKLVIKDVFVDRSDGQYVYRVHCHCDCGNDTDPLLSSVVGDHANTKSCGCIRSKTGEDLLDSYLYEGTRVTNFKFKPRSKTGVKGVRQTKYGKYKATLYFKSKAIYLGTFPTLEEAKKAREAAEEKYFKPVIEEFNKQAPHKVSLDDDNVDKFKDGKNDKK